MLCLNVSRRGGDSPDGTPCRRHPRDRTGHAALTSSHRATERPFTVVVCTACAADHQLSVIDELRPAIRSCPRAMLVSAACMLGPLTCASRPTGCGVMAMLQPCTNDRVPSGPPRWIGPITDHGDAKVLRDWLERGQWEPHLCQDSSTGMSGLAEPLEVTETATSRGHRSHKPKRGCRRSTGG